MFLPRPFNDGVGHKILSLNIRVLVRIWYDETIISLSQTSNIFGKITR